MNSRSSTLSVSHNRAGSGGADGRALDWDVAVATATRLIKPGPEIPRQEAERAVHCLRTFSVSAETHVRDVTGLGVGLPVRSGDVVDRPGWISGAAQGLSELTDAALSTTDLGQASNFQLLSGLGARSAGVQAGVVLAYLGTKVLGQYDPFAPGPDGTPTGRLLLVAPNIVAAQRALNVPVDDFLMWVCLHESTHRLQFTAVPWLRQHFAASLGVLLSEMESSAGELLGRLPSILREVVTGRGTDSSPGVMGVIELLQSPKQRAAFDRIIAISTLLEGHADHVMDAVGPRIVPSVHTIRARFTERRKGGGILDRLLRSLLGVDAKIKQYAQGAAFVRHVVETAGMEQFNLVWASPENLPTRAEISTPDHWIRRVLG